MVSNPSKLKSRKIPVALTLIVVSIIYAVWQNIVGAQQTIDMNRPTAVATSQPAALAENAGSTIRAGPIRKPSPNAMPMTPNGS